MYLNKQVLNFFKYILFISGEENRNKEKSNKNRSHERYSGGGVLMTMLMQQATRNSKHAIFILLLPVTYIVKGTIIRARLYNGEILFM